MNIEKTTAWLCAITLQVSMTAVTADGIGETNQRTWYLGVGLGATELDPDTNNTGYSVTDERSTGFKLFGGYDFSEHLTVEGFYTDLGSAKLNHQTLPDGEIEYSTLGASALWYFWRNGEDTGKNPRKGWQAYAHGGLSFINNSSSLNYDQDHSVQLQYGAGIEYGLNKGIALRAGIDLYDKDAGMAFFSVMKRFGM
jgi:OOP family OmpA-OmpF porin